MSVKPAPLAERFWSKVKKTNGCWLWTASLGTWGYGQIRVGNGARVAHRVAYEELVGPVPRGRRLDHLCGNRTCVNPAHLVPRAPFEVRFWSKVAKGAAGGCWAWLAGTKQGYGYARTPGKRGMVPAHRVSYELLVGPIPSGLDLDHLCRVRHCVNPAHLEPVTRAENTLRGLVPGNRWNRGEQSGSAKLTVDQVLQIREDGRGHRAIAAAYGVTKSAIGMIKSRGNWAWL